MRQCHPKTLSEAVAMTLERESYLHATPALDHEGPQEHKIMQPDLFAMISTLMEKLRRLECEVNQRPSNSIEKTHTNKNEGADIRKKSWGRKISPMSQVCDSNCPSQNDDVYTIAVNSISNYTMCACVFGNEISFLVDTDAAVSLVSSKVWNRIKPTPAPRMNPVGLRLVGVDGAPLHVQGSVTVELNILGKHSSKN